MNSARLYYYGKNGVLFGTLAGIKKCPPQVEFNIMEQINDFPRFLCAACPENEMLKILTQAYVEWGKFGPDGDLIFVNVCEFGIYIELIGRLAYLKPKLAADLLPFVIDAADNIFFIGIIRKNEPGKGKLGLIGGFLDVKGFHLETPAESLMHEGEEEAGLSITPAEGNEDILKDVPFAKEISVKVLLGRTIIRSRLQLVRPAYQTSNGERIEHLGIKRVDWTTPYALVLDYGQELTEASLTKMLCAGDDAERMVVVQLGRGKILDFGMTHHKAIFHDTLNLLRFFHC